MAVRQMIEIWYAGSDTNESLSEILKDCQPLDGVTIEFERGYYDSGDSVRIRRPETDEEMAARIAREEALEAKRAELAKVDAARAKKLKEAHDRREFARLKAKFEGQ